MPWLRLPLGIPIYLSRVDCRCGKAVAGEDWVYESEGSEGSYSNYLTSFE